MKRLMILALLIAPIHIGGLDVFAVGICAYAWVAVFWGIVRIAL